MQSIQEILAPCGNRLVLILQAHDAFSGTHTYTFCGDEEAAELLGSATLTPEETHEACCGLLMQADVTPSVCNALRIEVKSGMVYVISS